MTKLEKRRAEKEHLWQVCQKIYDEMKTINIPVVMPKIIEYRYFKSTLGGMSQTAKQKI